MRNSLLIFCLFMIGSLFASPAYSGPDCTCRYKGKNLPEGQSTCLKTANGYKVAKCARVLNNTSWKFTQKACPVG